MQVPDECKHGKKERGDFSEQLRFKREHVASGLLWELPAENEMICGRIQTRTTLIRKAIETNPIDSYFIEQLLMWIEKGNQIRYHVSFYFRSLKKTMQ